MATIEPGIYQIVNVGRGTAITVAAENTNTIVNWETHNGLNQQVWNVCGFVCFILIIRG